MTRIVVSIIITFDKNNCQNANDYCHNNGGVDVPLYNKLKEYRAKLGINQSELGKRVHVSRQTISLIERGDYSPSVTLALKISNVFNVTVEDIFCYEEGENENEEN